MRTRICYVPGTKGSQEIAMEHLEGRQSVLAALAARQRRFEVILVNQGAHEEKVQDVLDAAEAAGVPVKRVDGRGELDAMAYGATHGGILALVSAKPMTTPKELLRMLEQDSCPLLLLIEELRMRGILGLHCAARRLLARGPC